MPNKPILSHEKKRLIFLLLLCFLPLLPALHAEIQRPQRVPDDRFLRARAGRRLLQQLRGRVGVLHVEKNAAVSRHAGKDRGRRGMGRIRAQGDYLFCAPLGPRRRQVCSRRRAVSGPSGSSSVRKKRPQGCPRQRWRLERLLWT